ncbi:Fur family transcriptional regulator [Pseudomonadota bacterium]
MIIPEFMDRAKVIAKLLEHDIKSTTKRLEIAHYMLQRPQHLSADEILSGLSSENGKVSKATVYNTLALFVEKGLIREILINRERAFYDSNNTPHHHLYNVDTGTLSDIDVGVVNIEGIPNLPDGTKMDGYDLVIRVRN